MWDWMDWINGNGNSTQLGYFEMNRMAGNGTEGESSTMTLLCRELQPSPPSLAFIRMYMPITDISPSHGHEISFFLCTGV